MATDDAQTDLKKRARRRLVGAAALALLAVIVLPMVMDPAPKTADEDIQVRIPSQEGENFAQRRIETPAPPPVSEPVTPEPPAAAVDTPAPVEPPAPPAKAPAVDKTPKAEPKPAARPEPVAEKPAAPSVDERSRVEAILAGKMLKPGADNASPAASGEAFVVQLGAYSNEDSAAAQAGQARSKGFKVFTQKIGSTTRVRVGPYSSREAAEKAAAQLEKAGFKGVVMARG